MQIIEKLKGLITDPKFEINSSLYDWIESYLSELDPDPKFKIERVWLGPALPWVLIQDGCYIINTGKRYDGLDVESYGFRIAAKYVRKRVQMDNPQMVLFVPENKVDLPGIDQRIAESYFNNFDDKKETDAAIFSSLMATTFYLDDYPTSEMRKIINIDADNFAKIKIDPKKRKILI